VAAGGELVLVLGAALAGSRRQGVRDALRARASAEPLNDADR
jgi:hypothetical protein